MAAIPGGFGNRWLVLLPCLFLSGLFGYQFALWAAAAAGRVVAWSNEPPLVPNTLLIPSQTDLDLGTIPKGGSRSTTIWLENPTNQPVEVSSISTSCDCFEFTLERSRISPGERVKACATVDLASESDFIGGLCLEAEGTAKEQDLAAFVVRATIRVVDSQPNRNK
jgi:hypothetical protein